MSDKLPKLLSDLAAEVDQGFLEDTFEVNGRSYTMRLLSDGEANWKNRYIDALSSALSMISQRKAATLAVAIRKFDHQPVVELFAPKLADADSSEDEKKESETWAKMTKMEKQFSCARKLYDFLSSRPTEFTTALFEKFEELEKRRGEVMKELKKS